MSDVELNVRKPTTSELTEGQKYYNKAFGEALQSGAVLRAALDRYLREQKAWDDSKEKEYNELNKKIRFNVGLLLKGNMTVEDGKTLAMEVRKLRREMRSLNTARLDADNSTAESQAEQSRLNYLCSVCILNSATQKPYFDNYDAFLEKSASDPPVIDAVNKFMVLLYGLDDDFESQLPENQFLQKYHFVDHKNRLINSEGKLVDEDGHLINEEGRFINNEGNFVDADGNPVDEKGRYNFNNTVFIEDNGNKH